MFSSLISKEKYCRNNSGVRTHVIDRITPHCFVGQVTVERGLDVFYNSTGTIDPRSCNYVIGYDGKIGGCVPEEYRSWCSSNRDNDQRAITIEVASGSKDPYAFTDIAYKSLIDLTVDIMKRYNKDTLVWLPDRINALSYTPKSNEMLITVHRWFANKACPGNWLMGKMNDYVNQVNNKLKGGDYCMVNVRVCKKGDVNDTVKVLQSILKMKGYKTPEKKVLTIDGDFGIVTEFCVKNFQRDNGMTGTSIDGIVGEKTWALLLN